MNKKIIDLDDIFQQYFPLIFLNLTNFLSILQDPIKYPGVHNIETLRTNTSYDKLNPFRQVKNIKNSIKFFIIKLQTIFKSFSRLVEDKILEGQV